MIVSPTAAAYCGCYLKCNGVIPAINTVLILHFCLPSQLVCSTPVRLFMSPKNYPWNCCSRMLKTSPPLLVAPGKGSQSSFERCSCSCYCASCSYQIFQFSETLSIRNRSYKLRTYICDHILHPVTVSYF